jgi:hypothetical protein
VSKFWWQKGMQLSVVMMLINLEQQSLKDMGLMVL